MALIVDIVRSVLCTSWLNLLLVFVPVGYVSYFININSTLIFIFNALAIVPLSSLLTDVTEKIASDAGDTIGAILNISLGNLVELILFIVALKNDQIRVVQASILGSILVNLLLILGSALLTTKLPDQEFLHDAAGTQLLGSLLFVSVFTFLMPTAFDYTFRGTEGAEGMSLKMSRISAVMILLIYILYFFHEIKSRTPPHDVEAVPQDEENDDATLMNGQDHVPLRPMHLSSDALNGSQANPRTVRFVDVSPTSEHAPLKDGERDSLDGLDQDEAELEDEDYLENGEPKEEAGEGHFQSSRRVKTRGRSLSLGSSRGALSETSEGDRTELMAPYLTTRQILRDSHVNLDHIVAKPRQVSFGPRIDRIISYVMLIITSSLMSISAEFLASAIDDVIRQGHLSESLIGLIIMPIVGNVAEYATVVIVAARDNMGLALAVSVGSSIQIALCVTPLTVIAGWIMDRPLMLTFNLFEIATLLGSVLLVNFLILGEGVSGPLRSSGLKGGLMCACYVIIGLGAYLSP